MDGLIIAKADYDMDGSVNKQQLKSEALAAKVPESLALAVVDDPNGKKRRKK